MVWNHNKRFSDLLVGLVQKPGFAERARSREQRIDLLSLAPRLLLRPEAFLLGLACFFLWDPHELVVCRASAADREEDEERDEGEAFPAAGSGDTTRVRFYATF